MKRGNSVSIVNAISRVGTIIGPEGGMIESTIIPGRGFVSDLYNLVG